MILSQRLTFSKFLIMLNIKQNILSTERSNLNHHWLIFFFFFLSLQSVALPSSILRQNELPDSIFTRLNSEDITTKLVAYCDAIEFYIRFFPEHSLVYSQKAFDVARNANEPEILADILLLWGISYHAMSNYNDAEKKYEESLKLSKEIDFKVGIGKALNRLSLIKNVRGDFQSAVKLCIDAVKILEKENNRKALGSALNNLAILHYVIEDYNKARELAQKALQYNQETGDPLLIAASYEHLTILHIFDKKYDEAIELVEKTLKLRRERNDRVGTAGALENLAIIHRNLQKYDKALLCFNQSLELKKLLNNTRGVASSYGGIGVTYMNMGNYEQARYYLMMSYDIRIKLGDKRGLVATLNRISELHTKLGDYKSALEYFKLSKSYNDSLLDDQKNRSIAELQESFQSERQTDRIKLLEQENTLQKYLQNSLLVIALVLLIAAVAISIAYRSKRKANDLLISKNEEITKQKEELQELNEQLKDLNASKDKFFSIIAHDLQSPFQGFLGLTEVMAEDANSLSQTEMVQISKDLHETAGNLFTLLRNLLEWSQTQKGVMNFSPSPQNLRESVDTVISIVQNRATQKGISLENLIEGNVTVEADGKMLQSVLLNLLSNAIKFTRRGGKVAVSSKVNGYGSHEIAVADSGVGIPADVIDKLFKVGEKIGTKGTDGELSTGLGLIICHEFVTRHGGIITAESEPEKGSVFRFTLTN